MLNYRRLESQEEILKVAESRDDAWKDPALPTRQYDINIREVLLLDIGEWDKVAPYKAFMKALESIPLPKDDPKVKILEIGSSSGFYGKLLKITGHQWDYLGCDYSPHFIETAAKHFPGVKIETEDARHLSYPDASFDIAVSGCCLTHIYDWQKAVAETVRVHSKYVIFSRTPLLETSKTIYWEKIAYDVPCLEIWFNRESFMREIDNNGLKVIAEIPVFRTGDYGGYGHYSLVCEKK